MRRIRTAIVLIALACAVLAGSTSVVSAGGGPAADAAPRPAQSVAGKRWSSHW